MINILTDIVVSRTQKACVCVCLSPGCQYSEDYLMGYTDGYADGTLDR